MSVPENAFGTGTVAFNLMDRGRPPHAGDASSWEGVGQGGRGLVHLRLVNLLPQQFGGRMVEWFRGHAGLGGVVA